jgi:multiple sugar transport system permease protein
VEGPSADLPQLFVGATVAIIPVLLVFVFLQRYLVQGVERSGID